MASMTERIVRSLVDDGPTTAAALGQRFGITAGAVRRHLDPMVEQGLLTAGERAPFGPAQRRGRGRPARVYAVTDSGRAWLPQQYESLSVDVLRYLNDTHGEGAVRDFARHRLQRQRDDFHARLELVPAHDRPRILAELLSQEGYAASAETAPAPVEGTQICQHHCPIAHAATEFPQLCDAEGEMFSELLGTHVQRLATISHGAAVCTTHLPAASSVSIPASSRPTTHTRSAS